MLFPSNSSTPSHLSPIRQLQALLLLRAREKAGLSRAQMARKTGLSTQDVENAESGLCVLDIAEIDAWCRAAGISLSEFARELEVALAAHEAKPEADAEREEKSGRPESGNSKPSTTKVQLLYFAPGALPKLLAVENVFATIELLLVTNQVRVFATDSGATLGFCAAEGAQEDSAIGDDGGECPLLRPTETFLVLAGEFEGAEIPARAPRNEDLSWAPLAARVPLCPHTLDLASEADMKWLNLGSLSPLQVELVLDKFAPQLSDGEVERIMGIHPDGAEWIADWND